MADTPTITPTPLPVSLGEFMWNFLKVEEAVIPRVYSDSVGVPTLGVGYALIIPLAGKWRINPNLKADLGSIGITLSPDDYNLLGQVQDLLNQKAHTTDKTEQAALLNQIQALIPPPYTSVENIALTGETQKGQIWSTVFNPFQDIPLIDNTQARVLLDVILPVNYVKPVLVALDLGTMDKNGNITSFTSGSAKAFYNSREMAALVSMVYNGGPGKLTNDLVQALTLGDHNVARAEAWYNIRYCSDPHHHVPDRRYVEAGMFGLYDTDPTGNPVMNSDVARATYRMFTQHRVDMLSYDEIYAGYLKTAESRSQLVSKITGANLSVSDLSGTLAPACTQMLADLANNSDPDVVAAYLKWANDGTNLSTFNPVNLLLDPGRASVSDPIDPKASTYLHNWVAQPNTDGSTPANSILIAGGIAGDKLMGWDTGLSAWVGGNDLMIGGAGNDVFYGGSGHDYMAGGAGDDAYYIERGSTATIEDHQGNNTVFINGQMVGYFYKENGSNVYATVSDPNSTDVITGQFSGGDFVITDVSTADPNNPTTTTVILNQNFQSGDFGITLVNDQPSTSTTSTVITGQATTANGVSVTQFTGDGGNDIIAGTSGTDSVSAGDGNNLITGNGGQDIIFAGNGSNQIYANAQVGLATAIAQRSNSNATNQKGDLISVGTGNNTIVGSNSNDLIFTDGGHNTIVMGNGANVFLGGVSATAASTAWSVTQTDATHELLSPDINANATPLPNTPNPYLGLVFQNSSNGAFTPLGAGNDTIYGGSGNSFYALGNGNNWLDAGGGNDTIIADTGSSTIHGGNGNDIIFGSGGSHFITLGTGNSYVKLQGGSSTVIGGSGADTIISGEAGNSWADSDTAGKNYIVGGSGNAQIWGSGGSDTLISGSLAGTNQATMIRAGNGNEYIGGGSGNDTIYGGSGKDTIYAGDGNASIRGSSSTSENSSIYGGLGSDTIYGGGGTDAINAGDGGTATRATEVHAGNGTSTLYGGAGYDKLYGTTVTGGHDTLIAGTGTSILQGGAGTEVMYSSIGNATLIAGSGSDTLYGGGGTDVLRGGSGNALFVAGSGTETIIGGSGRNTYEFDPGFGNVEVKNVAGADTFRFGAGIAPADLTLSVGTGSDGGAALVIQYGDGQITVDGGPEPSGKYVFANGWALSSDQLIAQAYLQQSSVTDTNGNSTVFGSSDDYATVTGGTGNTTFIINNSTDVIQAQSTGSNVNTVLTTVDYVAPDNVQNLSGIGSANVSLAGNDLNNTITANSGNDTLIAGAGVATLVGGMGNDTFVVNNSLDVVEAQSYNGDNVNTIETSVSYAASANVQNLTGTGGADIVLTGNDLGDTITANSGNDTLIGGTGNDTLMGGDGQDTFVVSRNMGTDLIMDSSAQGAVLQLGSDVSASDLLYAQQGNDLLIGIAGSASSVRIRGYFLNQTAWSMDAGGVSQPLQVAPTPVADQQAQVAALAENIFIAKTKAYISSSYLWQGYVAQPDGTLATPYSTPRNPYLSSSTTSQQWSTEQFLPPSGGALVVPTYPYYSTFYWNGSMWLYQPTVTAYCDNSQIYIGNYGSIPQGVRNGDPITLTSPSNGNSVTYSYSQTTSGSSSAWSNWYMPSLSSTRGVVSFTVVTTDGSAPVITADHSYPTYSYASTGTMWMPVSWANTGNYQYSSSSAGLSYEISGGYSIDSVQATQSSQSTSISYYNGTPTGALMADPGSLLTPQDLGNSGPVLPQVLPVQQSQTQLTYEIQTIDLASGNHTVWGNFDTIVNGGAGDNMIVGAGLVYSGSGNDTISFAQNPGGIAYGGSGNDQIWGGDQVYSGTGNDYIYGAKTVYGGYGNDTIQNATVVYGGAGNDNIQIAQTVYAGSGNDTMSRVGTVYGATGNDSITSSGYVYAGSGNDTITNSGAVYAGSGNELLINDTYVVAGSGNDTILGGQATYDTKIVIDPNTVGNVLVGGVSDNGVGVLDAYYESQGIKDWMWNYKFAGTYSTTSWKNYYESQVANDRTWGVNAAGELWFFNYYSNYASFSGDVAATYAQQTFGMTLQQAIDQGLMVYNQPLTNLAVAQGSSLQPATYYASAGTPIAQTFKANDFAAMEPYYENGLLPPTETVKFGVGLSLSDLRLSWGQVTTALSSSPSAQPSKYTTLDITWGASQSVQVIIPHSDDPVGYAVSDFTFADGTTVSLADLIAMAPPAPSFDPQLANFVFDPTMGNQTLPNGITSIQFAAGINPSQISVTQDASGNFVVSYNNGAATLTIPAADAISSPVVGTFANGTNWQFVNANGGTFTYNIGDGVVYLINAASAGTVQFGAGITSGMITLGIGSLMLRVGNGTGDVLHIEGFNPQDALNSGEIQNFTFADGTTLSYAQLLSRGFDIYGTTGNETLTGTNLDNRIYAGTGNDLLIGSGAHDTLYGGVGADTLIGGAGQELMIAGSGLTTMIGGSGTDTFVVNNTADVVQAQAGAVNTIETSVSYTASANVQTLTGTGTANIVLTGNDIANVITANSGNDTLVAGSGVATMVGGIGNDTFVVNNVNDVVEAQSTGTNVNTIETSVSYTASANVQNLVGIGSADIALTGNDLADTLTANSGNDTLIAGSGVATMVGGTGNDTFVVNNVNDVVEAQSTGTNVNTIETSVSYTASANVQNLTGIGSADIALTGNDLANVVTANSGNDTLIAGSGLATLVGGAGNDTFYVNNTADVVQAQSTGTNVNTVYTSVSYVAPANVENLIGIGAADITLTGNDIADTISANSGNDTLVAGSGVATMVGGTGNDTFYVNNVSDVVEAQSTGTNVNTVYTSVSYVAPANVENLIGTGAADITLTGNGLADTIVANSGNDTLIAGSGLATLVGGAGNDSFYVNNSADLINAQLTGSNVNTAYASVDFSLATNGQNVQNLVGTGTGNLTLTGNSLDNTITANSGNDTLVSLSGNDTLISGTGVDTLVGGTGNDSFYVNNSADLINAQLTGANLNTAYASVGYDMATNAQNVQDLNGVGTADLLLTGNSLDNVITANSGNDFLNGGLGNDTLIGGSGISVLEDASGNNVLTDTQGQGVLYGGAGADTLTGGGGNSFFAGGAGNDIVAPGAFDSVVAFNAGDGADTIMTAAGGANTLSLGGAINFSSLSLARNGNDLIFNVSPGDSVTFHDWYASTANADFNTLQIIGPQKANMLGGDLTGYANEFNFSQIVAAFDKQTANKPPLSPWNMTAALVQAHLSSSDTAALGGDLAYYYGSQGSLAGMNLAAAQTTLKDPAFGTQPQTLNTLSSVQGAAVTL
jgi:Ca2+-binding RTX toxin-like protein/GH24 family phage-related lysozyme (muramidase)